MIQLPGTDADTMKATVNTVIVAKDTSSSSVLTGSCHLQEIYTTERQDRSPSIIKYTTLPVLLE